MANIGDCCLLVGNLNVVFPGLGCFVSINVNINTDYNITDCGEGGQTTGSLNISGYAGTEIHKGCPGRAGCQVLWLRKYECEIDKVHFIYTGPGRSFLAGSGSDYASLVKEFSKKTRILTASSQSGPTALYTDMEQTEGIGMIYSKGPIDINTNSEAGVTWGNISGIGTGDYYLQNFNIELVPGAIPVANYTFAFNI